MGTGNPPDKPYVVLTLSDDDDAATTQLQTARDNGLEVLFAVPWGEPTQGGTLSTRVILGNYKGK